MQDAGPAGIVSIEVENQDGSTVAPDGHEWLSAGTAFPGYSGNDALRALPEDSVNNNSGYTTQSPRLDYQVTFVRQGTHYIWVRAYAPSGTSNSLHVGLDGQGAVTGERIDVSVTGNYVWTNQLMGGGQPTLTVGSAGVHILNVWMRESGTVIDKIVLTTDPGYIPTGNGPDETLPPPPDTGGLVPLLPGFDRVSDEAWDRTAVRKVLHAFAYGGQAWDSQITAWADMAPDEAIVEMLTFDEHNTLLSPVNPDDYDHLQTRDGSLTALSDFWASNDLLNGTPGVRRKAFTNIRNVWVRSATSHGLNPFRSKIGLWETNYHMATNLLRTTESPMYPYYDNIMDSLAQQTPYQDVLSSASLSAAVALQYGHNNNRYIDGQCLCNEDFAREYYQLFFGILGNNDPDYHESVTIKNTAKALTDLTVITDPDNDSTPQVVFGTTQHYRGVLEMLNVAIGGIKADERIEQISQYAIEHQESLDNLPVMIIQGLADDNLDSQKIAAIRSAWAAMPEKNLLDFLRSYAISNLFHNPGRVKYLTSVDRHLLITNKVQLNNNEGYLELYRPEWFRLEGVQVFRPVHNVFGGQTGLEAADSVEVFNRAYDMSTDLESKIRKASGVSYRRSWEKNWASTTMHNGKVYVVANWLWKRFMADGLKNFGPLEKAHVYALLATGKDLAYLIDPDNADRVITLDEIQTDQSLLDLVNELAHRRVPLGDSDPEIRLEANERVGMAVNFIVATPFMFAQEGR